MESAKQRLNFVRVTQLTMSQSVPLEDASISAVESDSTDDFVLAHYIRTRTSEREVDLAEAHSDIHVHVVPS